MFFLLQTTHASDKAQGYIVRYSSNISLVDILQAMDKNIFFFLPQEEVLIMITTEIIPYYRKLTSHEINAVCPLSALIL